MCMNISVSYMTPEISDVEVLSEGILCNSPGIDINVGSGYIEEVGETTGRW